MTTRSGAPMRRRLTSVLVVAAMVTGASTTVDVASAVVMARSTAARHCPDSYLLLDKAPLVTRDGRRPGVAMLFSGQSTETEPPSPGFCFEVSLKPRYRRPFEPLRKKLTVTSPLTDSPDVAGTTESARRQFPIAVHASYFGLGCSAVAKASLRVGGRKATAFVRGAL